MLTFIRDKLQGENINKSKIRLKITAVQIETKKSSFQLFQSLRHTLFTHVPDPRTHLRANMSPLFAQHLFEIILEIRTSLFSHANTANGTTEK